MIKNQILKICSIVCLVLFSLMGSQNCIGSSGGDSAISKSDSDKGSESGDVDAPVILVAVEQATRLEVESQRRIDDAIRVARGALDNVRAGQSPETVRAVINAASEICVAVAVRSVAKFSVANKIKRAEENYKVLTVEAASAKKASDAADEAFEAAY